VLTRLYGTLGDARLVLAAVAAGAQALVAAAILLVVVLHVVQRRRQIGALRAFGAPRLVVFAMVWMEAFLEIGAGLPATFAFGDLAPLLALLAAGAAVALVPALLAYRQSPAAALRS